MFTEVGTVFSDFGSRHELSYAGDVAVALGLTLAVYVRHVPAGHDAADIVRARIASAVDEVTSAPAAVRLVTGPPCDAMFPAGMLVVGNAVARTRGDVATLAPADEARIFGRAPGPLMVPLGAGESGLRALRPAILLARRVGIPLLLWHTTWRKPDMAVADPAAHLCDGARRTLESAQSHAKEAGVEFRTIVEAADGVVEGLSRAALRERCIMVVAARGHRTTLGRYADALLARTAPVPLLTVDGVTPC